MRCITINIRSYLLYILNYGFYVCVCCLQWSQDYEHRAYCTGHITSRHCVSSGKQTYDIVSSQIIQFITIIILLDYYLLIDYLNV